MNRKMMIQVAIAMLIVFATVVVVYPLLFGSNESPVSQPALPPAVAP